LNIRINTVAPAVVETPVYNTFMTDDQVKETLPSFNVPGARTRRARRA
jgi:NAD(P)-dependent dehydrogenase (short-subunit alcohol dehydrogenase family)